MSGSTFDQYAEMQLDELLGVATEDAFVSCSRLYCEFRSHNPQIRGAVPVRASEVHEEPLDYCLSAEIIAKRVLSVREYVLWQRFSQYSPEAVEKLLPRSSKDTLRIHWAPLLTSFPQLFRKAQRAWNRAELKVKRKAERQAEEEQAAEMALIALERFNPKQFYLREDSAAAQQQKITNSRIGLTIPWQPTWWTSPQQD